MEICSHKLILIVASLSILLIAFISCIFILLFTLPPSIQQNPFVHTQNGLVKGAPGVQYSSISRFLGIPYAASPAGQNRWLPPQPAANWSGIFDATKFGDVCPHNQRHTAFPMSEDCLNLNIWTGAKMAHERRPVYVWIYGGRFNGGSSQDPRYDGEGLAQLGLVVVSLNYRTGVLGFLAHPLLSAESGRGSGNYGLLDQIAALHWVKGNIAAFGGDPSKVTIGGQSAGAASVLHLVNSPLAKRLFRGAIAESGARYPQDPEITGLAESYRTLERAEFQGKEYLGFLNVSNLEQLRNLSLEEITIGNDAVDGGIYGNPPLLRPVLDGHVIQHTYSEYLTTNLHKNDVPIITGNNKDESGASPNPQLTVQKFRELATTKYGPKFIDQFLGLYPASNDTEAGESSNQALRDNSLIGTQLWANLWATNAQSPTWNYFWSHAPPGQDKGAFHMSEIPYFMNNFYGTNSSWTPLDFDIGRTLSGYLVNFVANLDPNGPGLPNWPAASDDAEMTMHFGDGIFEWGYPIGGSRERIEFFKQFFASQTAY